MVGVGGLEPPTLRLSGVRSNHLSYTPQDPGNDPSGQKGRAHDDAPGLLGGATSLARSAAGARTGMQILRPAPSGEPSRAWWSQPGSNRRPPACKAGALPAELWPPMPDPAHPKARIRRHAPAVAGLASRRDMRAVRPDLPPLARRLPSSTPRIPRDPVAVFLRKEVIQPQVPLRLPCYDFTPVAEPTVAGCPPDRNRGRRTVFG